MRNRVTWLLLLLLPVCIPPYAANSQLLRSTVRPAAARIDAQLASVSVEPASRGVAVYPLPPTMTPFLPIWQAALQDALAKEGVFRRSAPRRMSVVVQVLEFSLSGKVLSVLARYQLFAVPSAAPVFSADIMINQGLGALATGVTSLEDPAIAMRNRTEVLRAIQANITQFIDQLDTFARRPAQGR